MRVDEYLAELRRSLRGGPVARRRILSEIRAHLEDALRQEQAAGYESAEAERRAVARVGQAEVLAAAFSKKPRRNGGAARGRVIGATVSAACVVFATAVIVAIFTETSGDGRRSDVRRALIAEQAGDYAEAHKWIVRAISPGSDDWRVWLIRARIEATTGHTNAALRSLEHARSLNPQSPLFRAAGQSDEGRGSGASLFSRKRSVRITVSR